MSHLNDYFSNVTEGDIKSLIKHGEGQQVELKETLFSTFDLAKNISAFANADGGVLILGVSENSPSKVHRIPNAQVDQLLDQVQKRVRPMPDIMMHRVHYAGETVHVIVVKPLRGEIVVSDAGAFRRAGARIVAMTSKEILASLPNGADSTTLEHMAGHIEILTNSVSELLTEQRYLQSFRGKLKSLCVSFVTGVATDLVSTLIFTFAFGP